MGAEIRYFRWSTIAGLALLTIIGAYLRLHNLDRGTVVHIEMFVPGIRLPHGISYPGERLTITNVLTGSFSSDTHPPGYYVFMWAWTKCFGTSAWSMRLPSVLFGVGCIPLVFWLGALTGQKATGWIAAALLAINGHHVFWSQLAKMFTLTCFLGLLATVLLVLIARDDHPPRGLLWCYVFVLLIGISSHIFYWVILGAHMVWTFLNAWARKQAFPGAGKLQVLALILGSPLLAFAAYQNGNPLAILSGNFLIYAREFLQFSFAFPMLGYSSGVFPDDGKYLVFDNPHLSIGRWIFFLLSLLLFVLGTVSMRKSDEKLLADTEGPSSGVWVLAAGLGTLAIFFFILTAKAFAHPLYPTLRTTELMAPLPFIIAGFAISLKKYWQWITSWLPSAISGSLLIGSQALILVLTIIPFALLTAVAFFKPIFNARGMLPLTPYVVLVLASGVVFIARYQRAAAACLLVVLGIAHFSGLRDYRHMAAGRADYKALGGALAPYLQKEDLIFLRPEFYSTPIFYYLHSDWGHIVGRNYDVACRQNPHARIWALRFFSYEETPPIQIEAALSNYQPIQTIEAPGAQAILYAPKKF